MHVFANDLMYVIPQQTIETFGLEVEQLLVDAGKMSHDDFIREFHKKEAEHAVEEW